MDEAAESETDSAPPPSWSFVALKRIESDLFNNALALWTKHPVHQFLRGSCRRAGNVPEEKTAQRIFVAQRIFHGGLDRFGCGIFRNRNCLDVFRVPDAAIAHAVGILHDGIDDGGRTAQRLISFSEITVRKHMFLQKRISAR